MVEKLLKNTTAVCINMETEDVDFLKSKGINRSKLMRQVTDAVKAGTFVYKYI